MEKQYKEIHKNTYAEKEQKEKNIEDKNNKNMPHKYVSRERDTARKREISNSSKNINNTIKKISIKSIGDNDIEGWNDHEDYNDHSKSISTTAHYTKQIDNHTKECQKCIYKKYINLNDGDDHNDTVLPFDLANLSPVLEAMLVMVCVSAGTSEIKTPFNAISLFKCCHPKINSISIQDSAPLSDDVTEVTNCGNTCSVPPKRCICVGLMDNNLVSGTVHSCTSTFATAHDTAKYCKQTICKEDSLTHTSDTNDMADEDCCASSHEIKLVLLLYFLMLSLSGEKCSVHTIRVQYPLSCHLSPCTHQKFHNHLYCHKCHKVVCCGNVKDHIEHNLCATNNSLKTLAYLLKTSSTLAPMELQISNEHMDVPNNIFTDTSKNTYEILAMCTPYKKVCKFFKTTKIYFKKNYTYALYKFTKLIIVKKLFNTLKALSYKNVFQRLPIFQLQCTRNKVPEKLEGRQQDIKRLNAAVVAVTKDSCKALEKHLAGYDIPSLNVSLLTKKDIDNKAKKSQKEEKLPKINVSTQLSVIKKGNKFQNANDVYQATPPSSVSLEHKLIFGNVTTTKPSCTTDHKPLGAHIVMGLQSKKLVSTICPQNDILFNTKLIEHNEQTLHEEVKQTRNEMVRFHQFDIKWVYPQMDIKKLNFPNIPQVRDKLPVKLYTVTIQVNKTANIALPKRSYILCRHERYPIINCYPYMDHCYEQKRTQIQSSHCFLKTSTTFIFSFGLLSEGDCLEDIVLTFYTKSCSCSSDKNHYKIDNIALTFHPIMSYDLQNLCLVSFFAYILNSNYCARKADINRLVEPPLFSNFAASLIKLTEGFMRSSLYAILRKLYQLMGKVFTKNLEIIKYLEAMFNIRFKEPSKSSISEEKGHGNNLLEQILLSDMIGLPIFVSDEDKKRNNKHMPLQVVGNSQLLNSALKFQANVNAVFSLAINKVNTENNTEIQGSISSIQSKYLLSEMLPEYYKSIFKDNELLATLPSLAPKCSTALNTREVIFSTTLEITWCNSIAYRYPTANGDHLFIEMVGSLQESKIPYMVIDLRKCIDLTHTTASYLSFNATLFGHLRTENISITEIPHLSLDMNTFYFSYLYNCLPQNFSTESRSEQLKKYSQLIVPTNITNTTYHIVTGLVKVYHQLADITNDIFRPFGKTITPAVEPVNQQSATNSMIYQQSFSSQEDHCVTDGVAKVNEYAEGNQQSLQQSSVAAVAATTTPTNRSHQPIHIQPECHHMPVSNTNLLTKDTVETENQSPKHVEEIPVAHVPPEQDVVESDGKLSMASGTDQATPISSIPSEHKLMIGNVTTKASGSADHNPLGAHYVKGLPKQTELLPTVGPQHNAIYNTNFEHEVQSSHEEVRQKRNARTTFYQHEFEQHAYNPIKVGNINLPNNPPVNDKLPLRAPEAKAETGNAANDFKPKPLPKRSCIVCGGKQYPLVNNLISHPHMDHYFVKERKEIRPSHYLAKLVLRHQYLNRDDVNEDTTAVTAAQQSQAAVLAADSAVEKDGAVTERKHFPMNLNMSGFVVFSSDLTRFTGNIKYPLPSRKATAVKLGKGGNGFVFAIFHNGKEYAVKKTVYRPNEIRVHSQLAHPNLVNLDAVLIGEEHEKHKGKFYAFCFMTKCDMDFRSVISTKEHGCLKHLKLQLSDQHDVWQLVMVNVKYVLKSVLKALDYMHKQGLVHRDVKASNILLKMQCHCTKPLMCACPQKYLVKLGDFDSSTTVPGHGLKIEPHQMIRYASVLPLGTMGYRAPEVSMHLVIAGPYEVLYTTAVDIWSFGCLLLNMLIGKCGPLKQRGEASLLLSTLNQPYAESLYNQIIKIKELQKYYGNMPEMVDLVRKCLQVEVHCRPSAKQLLQLDILQCV